MLFTKKKTRDIPAWLFKQLLCKVIVLSLKIHDKFAKKKIFKSIVNRL